MTNISHTVFSDAFSRMNFFILMKSSLKFVPKGRIDSIPTLDNGLRHRIGEKPLFEPMLTWSTAAYMYHQDSES